MPYSQLPIDERLNRSRKVFSVVVSNPAVAAKLARLSYTTEKMAVGKSLQEKSESLQAKQVREYGEAFAMTAEVQKTLHSLRSSVIEFRELAQLVMKNQIDFQKSLLLNTTLKQSIDGGLPQIRRMITNIKATPAIMEMMGEYGVEESIVEDWQKKINQLQVQLDRRDIEHAEAQNASRERDAAMDDLDDWMVEFLGFAKIALKDTPELFEVFGDVVPS